jgi:hypothetical protein
MCCPSFVLYTSQKYFHIKLSYNLLSMYITLVYMSNTVARVTRMRILFVINKIDTSQVNNIIVTPININATAERLRLRPIS